MADEKSTGRPLDATGETVRSNIRRVRDKRGISAPELSARLGQMGRPIPPLGIHRIETGKRRVDVDDLLAFAAALNVSPAGLLMPAHDAADDLVTVTGSDEPATAEAVWMWLSGERPFIPYGRMSAGDQWVEFAHESWPSWKVREMYHRAYEDAVEEARREGRDLAKEVAELEARDRGDD